MVLGLSAFVSHGVSDAEPAMILSGEYPANTTQQTRGIDPMLF